MNAIRQILAPVVAPLNGAEIAHALVGPAALAAQGVETGPLQELTISVQWDQFQTARELLAPGAAVTEQPDQTSFTFAAPGGEPVRVIGRFNYVLATDPDRVWLDEGLWAQSVLGYRRLARSGDPLLGPIARYLQQAQADLNRHNARAWTENPYTAWVNRYGEPAAAARALMKHPQRRLAALWPHLGPLPGRRVINLMGSHGAKAVAMALLGAQVTVVDISPENARYAGELAAAAGASLRYLVTDVLALPPAELTSDYDLVVMELGILHYFVDLAPLFRVVAALLRPGGRLVLQDFHPVSTKLISSKGKKHKVTGNYFASDLVETGVAYSGYLDGPEAEAPRVRLRKWTLGEVVTAVAGEGLHLRVLEEEPNHKLDDIGLPKTFTLVAERPVT